MLRSAPRRLEDAREGANIQSWLTWYQRERLRGLALDNGALLRPSPLGGVLWLDLDRAESRYLLAGCTDASVLLYDTQGQEEHDPSAQGAQASLPGRAPLLSLTKGTPGGHTYSVSCVAWYPQDNGLFVTGSNDCTVRVWDANVPALADSFTLASRVHCLALSPLPGAHCMTAVGTEDAAIQLCDLASGARLHELAGHRAPVWTLAWSPAAEWQLASGSADGSVRLWDVRRAGASLAVLDMEETTAGGGGLAAATASAAPDPAARRAGRGVRAHRGAVTGLLPSPDGRLWVSAGADDAVRVWDSVTHRHTMVHFAGAFNRARRPRRLALAEEAGALFMPSGSAALGYDLGTGTALCTLRGGHYEAVNACVWNQEAGELVTAGADRLILVWAPQDRTPDEDGAASDWSDG